MLNQNNNGKVRKTARHLSALHYVWGRDCDGWRLVDHSNLSIIHERMPAGRTEARHWHAHARQFFFVLSGTLSMALADETIELGPQEGLEIAPGLAHQARNDSNQDVEFLVISNPSTKEDRFEF